jgi:cytochrome c biogenesis protein ResB
MRTLASLRLAVAILAALILSLAAGSLVEARLGSEAARTLVYRSAWFHLLLGALFLNVLSSLLVRIPLSPRQYGFAATHVGILTILVGAAVTALFGLEGVVVLPEGGTAREMLREDGRRASLPFELLLRRFETSRDPGSEQASGYVSRVEVRDGQGRIQETAAITMNRPLRRGGWAIYQSGYEISPGRPTRSFLIAARDPGRSLKYLGGLVTMAGIAWHFWRNRHAAGKARHD